MNHALDVAGKEVMESMRRSVLCLWGTLSLAVLMIIGVFPAMEAFAQQGRYTVLIDPAHGGEETGVVADGIREKDLTLKIALLIRQEGRKAPNLQFQLTRSADVKMSIAERIKAAGAIKPNCIVSIHINAGFGKNASGYEVYFPGFGQSSAAGGESTPILKDMVKNRYLNDSVRLAQQIQAGLETVVPRKGRGLRDAPVPLLEGVTIPGVAVEVGFATNAEDRKKLTEEETHKAVARAVVQGLQNYFQNAP